MDWGCVSSLFPLRYLDPFPSHPLTLKMATSVYTETLKQLQRTTWLNPERRGYIFHRPSKREDKNELRAKSSVVWDVAPCCLVEIYVRLGAICRLHLS